MKFALLNAIKFFGESTVTVLGMHDHLSALKQTIFSLDSHAQEIFENHLAVEQTKSRERIEEMRMMLAALHQSVSSLPN